jgi:hypothetical protein
MFGDDSCEASRHIAGIITGRGSRLLKIRS